MGDEVTHARTVLELIGIAKRFGRLSVLRDVNLNIEPGDVVGLIGANGAGKTTLLSIIAGLVQPTGGRRRFWGDDVVDISTTVRGRIAVVTHTAQIYARLTARENLELFADLRQAAGLSSAPCLPLLDRLGLAQAADRLAGTFSRGMSQRLALARALVGQPELLLLDEPFTALDRPGRVILTDVLRQEQRRGTAVLASSHDFDAIAGVTGRVVLLEDGTIAGDVRHEGDEEQYREEMHRLIRLMPGHETLRSAGHA